MIVISPAQPVDQHNGQAGLVAPSSRVTYELAAALTASQAYLARFVPSRSLTVTTMAFAVSTAAGADDACDVGIYDSTLTRIVSAGATTGKLNAAGTKTVAITPTTLTAGTVYYAAFSVGTFGGTAAQLLNSQFGSVYIATLFGASAPQTEALVKAASHPLPASIAAPTAVAAAVTLGVRES